MLDSEVHEASRPRSFSYGAWLVICLRSLSLLLLLGGGVFLPRLQVLHIRRGDLHARDRQGGADMKFFLVRTRSNCSKATHAQQTNKQTNSAYHGTLAHITNTRARTRAKAHTHTHAAPTLSVLVGWRGCHREPTKLNAPVDDGHLENTRTRCCACTHAHALSLEVFARPLFHHPRPFVRPSVRACVRACVRRPCFGT